MSKWSKSNGRRSTVEDGPSSKWSEIEDAIIDTQYYDTSFGEEFTVSEIVDDGSETYVVCQYENCEKRVEIRAFRALSSVEIVDQRAA